MSSEVANRESILIAIIAAAGDDGLDRVQLQKAAFLVGEEFQGELPENFYQFRPYLYGPFAQQIYSDVERLSDGPIIEAFLGDNGRPSYRLAHDARCGRYVLSDDLESGVKRVVGWVSRIPSFDELVRAIYFLYPEQRENSIFEYSEDLAEEESLARSFRDMAAGRTRPADELLVELQDRDSNGAQTGSFHARV